MSREKAKKNCFPSRSGTRQFLFYYFAQWNIAHVVSDYRCWHNAMTCYISKKTTTLLESRTLQLVNVYIESHYQIQQTATKKPNSMSKQQKRFLIRFWDFFGNKNKSREALPSHKIPPRFIKTKTNVICEKNLQLENILIETELQSLKQGCRCCWCWSQILEFIVKCPQVWFCVCFGMILQWCHIGSLRIVK